MKELRCGIVFIVLLISCGCAATGPKISNVFDDLVNETVDTDTTLFSYRSFLSISGLSPVRYPGMYVIHPSGVSPTHTIGVSPKWSHYIVSEYAIAKEDEPKMGEIAAKYQDLAATAKNLTAMNLIVKATETVLKQEGTDDKRKLQQVCQILDILGNCTLEVVSARRKTVTESLRQADEKFEAAKTNFTRASNINNTIIMRWTKTSDNESTVNYGTLAGAGFRERVGKSGIAIYGGLRVQSLYIGEDFIDMVRRFSNYSEKWVFTRSSVPTYQVQAKYIEYVSDENEDFQARFNAKFSLTQVEAIKAALSNLSDTTEIALSMYTGLLSDVGNKGRLQNPMVSFKPFCFFPPRAQQKHLEELVKDGQGFSSIYGVETQLQFFASMFLNAPETDLMRIYNSEFKEKNNERRQRLLNEYVDQCGNNGKHWNTFEPPFDDFIPKPTATGITLN